MSNTWLHSTKYDGSLHYRYPVLHIRRSEEGLITYSHPGVPVESYRGSWVGKKHILSHFWRERPYVLHVLWDNHWQPEYLYVDITTATNWPDGNVHYIDLDLDLILRPGSNTAHLADADEFETNRVRWNYPEDLVRGCWAAVEEVRGFLETETEPFTPALFAWRPGEALKA